MTQEEKDLLLKDLCARFPYGVKLHIPSFCDTPQLLQQISDYETVEINDYEISIDNVKPYLRPMSSMTEEEKETYHNLCSKKIEKSDFGEYVAMIYYHDTIDSIDYLTSIHIDYRGLIPNNLAIEVTEENNPYK